jgi:hypothetical protein
MSDNERALNREVQELRKVLYAGFVLIAAELDMTRNAERRTGSVEESEKDVMSLMSEIMQHLPPHV